MPEALVGEYRRAKSHGQAGRSIACTYLGSSSTENPNFELNYIDSSYPERRQDLQNSSQSSQTLLPSVIVPAFGQSGQITQNAGVYQHTA